MVLSQHLFPRCCTHGKLGCRLFYNEFWINRHRFRLENYHEKSKTNRILVRNKLILYLGLFRQKPALFPVCPGLLQVYFYGMDCWPRKKKQILDIFQIGSTWAYNSSLCQWNRNATKWITGGEASTFVSRTARSLYNPTSTIGGLTTSISRFETQAFCHSFNKKSFAPLLIVMLQPCCINKYYPHTESARHEIEEEVNMITMWKNAFCNNQGARAEGGWAERDGWELWIATYWQVNLLKWVKKEGGNSQLMPGCVRCSGTSWSILRRARWVSKHSPNPESCKRLHKFSLLHQWPLSMCPSWHLWWRWEFVDTYY